MGDLVVSDVTEETQLFDELKRLLIEFDIRNIVSFDDEWGKFDSSKGAIESYVEEDIYDTAKNFHINISDEDQELLDQHDCEKIKHLLETKVQELLDLQERFKEVLGIPRNLVALEILEKTFTEICNEIGIGFVRSEKLDYSILKDLHGRTLFLIDMNMSSIEGHSADVVVETILHLTKLGESEMNLAIVYSYEKLESYDNHNTKLQYVEEVLRNNPDLIAKASQGEDYIKYLLAYQLWGVNKTGEVKEFINSLNKTLGNAAFGHSLHDYLSYKINISEKALKELIQLSDRHYEYLYNDSFIEGERFIDILDRTHNNALLKSGYIASSDDTKYQNILKNVMKVAETKSQDLINEIGDQNLSKYRKEMLKNKIDEGSYKELSEYEIIDYSVNSLFGNIDTGDLFKLNIHGDDLDMYGILINASCDLPLRFDSNLNSEIKRNDETVFLALYKSSKVDDSHREIKEYKEQAIWPIKNPDNPDEYFVLIPTNKLISLEDKILDLCTLNREGWASLDFDSNTESLPFKTVPFIRYLDNNLKPWAEGLLSFQSYINIELLEPNLQEKEKGLLLQSMIGLKYNIIFNIENKRFNVKRIGKLNNKHTLKVIQDRMSSFSRIGLEKVPFR